MEIAEDDRPTGRAMRRGAMLKCPACGDGRMFAGYLKVRDHCPHCGEALHHQRADDGPAYLTVLIVSHIGAPLLLWVFLTYQPSPVSMLIWFSLGAVVLSLALLPVLKGALVGAQWARRMHGFGGPGAEPSTS
ncbi:Uncharacterized conserved protein, DUF983 family [Paracoccus isoporae]|uniref:Uncharacterized conserved protein, DUF983 family n=1 Tax=Paracoccus isoporae TaxID=591205 RepID=A0A1G7BGL9_9RHOB|nr:DUF983 domain-containing protein [Paracoccus isoporae]SDE25375.1 Uncharacterized conserved protein, DUF983 family [Paracoccus isoporae]